MSVTDPLLKDLKGSILQLLKINEKETIRDSHSELETLCKTLEVILRKGLICTQPSPFGITRRDYWTWIQHTIPLLKYDMNFKVSMNKILESQRVSTSQGKGRLFIRHSLMARCFHIPIEDIVRNKCHDRLYNEDSIIGDEILGEIFLSLVYQLSQFRFELRLENAAFLDDTWQLPDFEEHILNPCLDLGIYLGHVKGWAVVLNLDDGSIAAEDNKIERGDVIDEIFGVCIKGWRKGRISALFRQNKGIPISLKVIKGHHKDGRIYEGLLPILRRLELDTDYAQDQMMSETSISDSEDSTAPQCPINGHSVEFLGSVDVGSCGDVTHIEHAVTTVLNLNEEPVPVVMVTGEIGVQTVIKSSRKILFSHSYTEISSCGRRNDSPLIFGYIAGNTSCSISSHFTCYVYRTSCNESCREILLTLADGFHRTHWAV